MISNVSVVVILLVAAGASGLPRISEEPRSYLTPEAQNRAKQEFQRGFPTNHQKATDLPTQTQFGDAVAQALSLIDISLAEPFLRSFTAYHDRNYRTIEGVAAAVSLHSQLEELITSSEYQGTATARLYLHDSWPQPSVIVRIQGVDEVLKDEVVILGAHLDSTSNSPTGRAPGADDNGASTSVLILALHALLGAQFVPKRTIEIQWYAAEEEGLLGSADFARHYATTGVNVHSMINLDVVGYKGQAENVIGYHRAYTADDVTTFLLQVIQSYGSYRAEQTEDFDYPFSDHASFHEAGFRTAYPVEFTTTPHIHRETDTVDTVNFEQVHEFVKIAVAYSIEMGEPTTSSQ